MKDTDVAQPLGEERQMKNFVMFFATIIAFGLTTLSAQQSQQPTQTQVASNDTPSAPTPVAPAVDVKASNPVSVPEPEWPGRIYLLSDGKLLPLEQQNQRV